MKVYQEVLNALTAETQGILETNGYNGNSLVLNITLKPGIGWCYEALASRAGKFIREKLVSGDKPSTPEQFLEALRKRVEPTQLPVAA